MRIIIQRFGQGDIIFSMSAIRSLNDKILWPVLPEYVEYNNRAYPDIMFVNWEDFKIDYNRKDEYTYHGAKVIPLAWQDTPLTECMKNKYLFLGRDWTTWKQNAHWVRDSHKEAALFKYLGLEWGEPFNLINVKFGCWTKQGLGVGVSTSIFSFPQNGFKNVFMDMVPGFSLFDWALVIQKAATIHIVSTSIIYLLELLKLEAKEIHIYIRRPNECDHRNYEYILSKDKPYILEP